MMPRQPIAVHVYPLDGRSNPRQDSVAMPSTCEATVECLVGALQGRNATDAVVAPRFG
jgi:hypothetical protein